MQLRVFGRTGMRLSVLGFGCGVVGGLMVRGDAADQERTIARAVAAGVNYFDTAVQYGDGESEKNLGRVLQKLKPADVVVDRQQLLVEERDVLGAGHGATRPDVPAREVPRCPVVRRAEDEERAREVRRVRRAESTVEHLA